VREEKMKSGNEEWYQKHPILFDIENCMKLIDNQMDYFCYV